MRFELSDEEGALLEPLLPKSRKSARVDDRKIVNAIFLCATHRNAVAGFASAQRPLHDRLQSLQSLVPPRYLEACLRPVGIGIAR